MSRIVGLRWDSWPDPADVRLLRALLHVDPDVARASWHEFRDGWDPDDPTEEQYRLFGMIAGRLAQLEVDDDWSGVFHGVRRRTAVHTLMSLERLDRHLGMLSTLGVEAVVLKGSALVLTVYDSMGDRWFADLDLLVPPSQWERVAATYGRDGWIPTHDDFGGNHGVNLRRDGEVVDLHRLAHSEMVLPGRIDATMSVLETTLAERPLPSDRQVRVLCPTDSLLHTLVHGTQRLQPINLRWAVDADRIITRSEVDWWRLVDLARTFRLSPLIHDALVFLASLTGRPVDRRVLDSLASDSPSWLEARRLDAFHQWPAEGRLIGRARINASWALWQTRSLTPTQLIRAFPGAMARSSGADSVWRLPGVVVHRLGEARRTTRSARSARAKRGAGDADD